MKNDLPVSIRPAVDNDYGFILSSWTKYFHLSHPNNFIDKQIYYPAQTKLINSILKNATTTVCHIEDEPDNLIGYLVHENFDSDTAIVHYGFVKGIFRRLGIMKECLLPILDKKNIICTHYFDLLKKKRNTYHLIYDPTILEKYK